MATLTTTHGTFNGANDAAIVKREFGARAYINGDMIVRRNAYRRTNRFIAESDRVLSAILETPEV